MSCHNLYYVIFFITQHCITLHYIAVLYIILIIYNASFSLKESYDFKIYILHLSVIIIVKYILMEIIICHMQTP